jgi:hypothetical protein
MNSQTIKLINLPMYKVHPGKMDYVKAFELMAAVLYEMEKQKNQSSKHKTTMQKPDGGN